ncbi:hypothetical protein OEIGOIKO_04431 [Streptomyces chrestomyceticus JCM 4735]|uniref:Uncharacterized protein n=1 Tax=Streptomyces chrestomyceticus JCM 4735 TaxID=1306181 RepID=A0A7U9PZU2_9ACTN|nr:hypothetical protein OEIGOIKO_04431 [Streptomyces chrestomyceticus JCM 4735]
MSGGGGIPGLCAARDASGQLASLVAAFSIWAEKALTFV